MKLVILTSRVPWPLDKGDKLRIYHQIRILSNTHEVHLITLSEQKNNKEAKIELLKYCKTVHIFQFNKFSIFKGVISAFISGKPLQIGYFYNRKIDNKIKTVIQQIKPNHIYGQLVRVAEYIKDYPISKTLDLQDALSTGLQRRALSSTFPYSIILKMEHRRMLKYEAHSLSNFDFLTIITQADKDLLPLSIRKRVNVVPNGVELDYFKPTKSTKKYNIVFTGNMNYPPNIMAANFLIKEIMPIVWEHKADTSVLLAGSSPNASVINLANNNVFVSGWMDDIRNAYSESEIFIAPMQIGTGLQNKLLEAMAMKMACITSDLANLALKAKHEKEILVAPKNDANLFAKHILKLLNDHDYANHIALNAHQFVQSNYDWKSITNTLNNIWKINP